MCSNAKGEEFVVSWVSARRSQQALLCDASQQHTIVFAWLTAALLCDPLQQCCFLSVLE
jgi:hypothetical protein